jgi:hypothetical protein
MVEGFNHDLQSTKFLFRGLEDMALRYPHQSSSVAVMLAGDAV